MKPWKMILLYGVLIMLLIGFGTFFDLTTGIGFFFLYVTSYFNAILIVLPILLIRRFGVGVLLYLPCAILGLAIEYYMEVVYSPVLKSPWLVPVFCLMYLIIGLSADLSFKYIPKGWDEKRRAIYTGIVPMVVNWIIFVIAALYFYIPAAPVSPAPRTILTVAFWAFPWLLLSAAFGGYTSYLMVNEKRT